MNEIKVMNFEINSIKDAMEYARMISNSDLAPKEYKGKPENVLVAMQYGAEIGLKPLQAIQNIAVINGRPCVWGDAMIALVRSNPICEDVDEKFESNVAICTVKRKGSEPQTRTFSVEDAKKAGLWGKSGPWTQYPNRMLQLRARAFALRDVFANVLKGMAMREEVMDYEVDVTPKEQSKSLAKERLDSILNTPKDSVLEQVTDDLSIRVTNMLNAFMDFEISSHELEERIGHPISEITKDDLDILGGIYKSIKSGAATVEHFFPLKAS